MTVTAETALSTLPVDWVSTERQSIEEGMWDLEGHFGYTGLDDPKIQQDIDEVRKDFEIYKEALNDKPNIPTYDYVTSMLMTYESLATRILRPYAYGMLKETENIHCGNESQQIVQISLDLWYTIGFTVEKIIAEYKKDPSWSDINEKLKEAGWSMNILSSPKILTEEQQKRFAELKQQVKGFHRQYQDELSKITISIPGSAAMGLFEAQNRMKLVTDEQERYAYRKAIVEAKAHFASVMVDTLLDAVVSYREEAQLLDYPDAMRLSLVQEHVSADVYDTLVRVAGLHVEDFWRRYCRELSRVLKISEAELQYDDTAMRVIPRRELAFADALDAIASSWGQIDEEFASVIRHYGQDKRILWKNTRYRSSRNYMYNQTPGMGTFLSVRYDGGGRGPRNLAHELGHAVHATLVESSGKSLFRGHNIGRSAITSEIFSLFFENIYRRNRIDATSDARERAALIISECGGWFDQIFLNIRDTEFEKDLHRYSGEHRLGAQEQLSIYFRDLMRQWNRPSLGQEELEKNWVLESFYYSKPFKLWPYAISQMIVLSINELYEEAREKGTVSEFANTLKAFMAAGGSKDPQELLRDFFGIELGPELYEKGFRLIHKRLDEAAALLDSAESTNV